MPRTPAQPRNSILRALSPSAPPQREQDAASTVWIHLPDQKELYALAHLESTVDQQNRARVKIARTGAPAEGTVFPFNRDDETQSDLVRMTNVDVPNMLNTLAVRHELKKIYTNVGAASILISINPYTQLPNVYGVAQMRAYHEAFSSQEALEPHIYSIAAGAYRNLAVNGASQTVVLSGESGAGKTENAKHIFRWLATISGGSHSVESVLLNANPVCEAFGNAKTVRNLNSSRFGKLVMVHFGATGVLSGSSTSNFLLEQTRVCGPAADERNYHIFYQLLAGLSDAELQARHLGGAAPKDFRILASSKCVAIEGVDDRAEWRGTEAAMLALSFEAAEVTQVIDVVAAVLHLGNVAFEADASMKHRDGDSRVANMNAVAHAADLLGVEKLGLSTALTKLLVRDEAASLNVSRAGVNRDALVKALYNSLFDLIVRRINHYGREVAGGSVDAAHFIGVLDIFGFEIFKTNSLEQLLINFANEMLQRSFTLTTFHSEEGLYEREGIAFEHIPYVSNEAVLSLIDHKHPSPGLLQILEEESRLPGKTDATLLDKFTTAHSTTSDAYSVHFKTPTLFSVRHYAGEVIYASEGLLEKVTDLLAPQLVSMVKASSKPLVAELFAAGGDGGGAVAVDSPATPRGGGSSRKPTVGVVFARQLSEMMELVDSTTTHYVRCIKPNQTRSPTDFDFGLSLEQLTYSGVFEAVQIRKAGYPFRMAHAHFVARYRTLLDPREREIIDRTESRDAAAEMLKMLPAAGAVVDACATLRAESVVTTPAAPGAAPPPADGGDGDGSAISFGLDSDLLSTSRVGHTLVFYRSRENLVLEAARKVIVTRMLDLGQRWVRGGMARALKRRLRATRERLAAAIESKELVQVEAALTALQTRQRGFHMGAPLDFSLYAPNKADAEALRGDLVEEQRITADLSANLASTDMLVVYPAIRADHEVGIGLAKRLGREVPPLATAECVCGLVDGVAEHDYERINAALAQVEVLGLASKLARPIELAHEELGKLEKGRELEALLVAELGERRSRRDGETGLWTHKEIALDKLKAALAKAEAMPLVSKSGTRLIVQARLSLRIRECLKKSDWAALLALLIGLTDDDAKTAEEAVRAWEEVEDQCAVLEAALVDALSSNCARKLAASGAWDRKEINVAPLDAAAAALGKFPHVTPRAEPLLAQASLAAQVRQALKRGCSWKAASSWGDLDRVLSLADVAVADKTPDVLLARQEMGEMRATLREAVEAALSSGFSQKPDADLRRRSSSSRARSASALNMLAEKAAWVHSSIETKVLKSALEELAAFPKPDEATVQLAKRADLALKLRAVIKTCDWAKSTSWIPLAELLETTEYAQVADEWSAVVDDNEASRARLEFEAMRDLIESAVQLALSLCRSVQVGESPLGVPAWDHSSLSSKQLRACAVECAGFPRPSEEGQQLQVKVGFVAEMRDELLKCDVSKPSSWEGLVNLLDEVPIILQEDDEVAAALDEFEHAGDSLVAGLRQATQSGRAERVEPGVWRHECVRCDVLSAAIDALVAFPRRPEGSDALVREAELALKLRQAVIKADWTASASWKPLMEELDAVEGVMRMAEDFSIALDEFQEKHRAVEGAVSAALRTGRSVRAVVEAATAPSMWNHDAIEIDALGVALGELRAFPREDEAGKRLQLQGDAVLAVRKQLKSCSWSEALAGNEPHREAWKALGELLDRLLPELRELDEVGAAQQELLERRLVLESGVTAALGECRSEAPAATEVLWSHEQIAVEGLRTALEELSAWPRAADATKRLCTHAEVIIELRTILLGCDWASSASWAQLPDFLEGGKAASLASSLEELREASAEFCAFGAYLEEEVRAALEVGGAERLPNGGWSNELIQVERLRASVSELDAYPRKGDKAASLVKRGGLVVELRGTLLGCDWAKAASWAPLHAALDSALARELSGEAEVVECREQLLQMQEKVFGDLERALSEGKAVRIEGAPPDTPWDHSTIEVEPLSEAIAECEAFPCRRDGHSELLAMAAIALRVRRALALTQLGDPASWLETARVVDSIVEFEVQQACEELLNAGVELREAGSSFEAAVKRALASGRSRKEGNAWSHDEIDIDELSSSLDKLALFPKASESARALIEEGKLALAVRESLLACDWSSAASWDALLALLESVPPAKRDYPDVRSGWAELLDKREALAADVRRALAVGQSVRPSPSHGAHAPWNHSELDTDALDKASSELRRFASMHPERNPLLAKAKAIKSLRVALRGATQDDPSTWKPLASLLQELSAVEVLVMKEVKEAWAELDGARGAAIEKVDLAMAHGRSVPKGDGSWDHSRMDTNELSMAAFNLGQFPKVEAPASATQPSASPSGKAAPRFSMHRSPTARLGDASAPAQPAARVSVVARRESMAIRSKTDADLETAARVLIRLRTLIVDSNWSALKELLAELEASPLCRPAQVEVAAAAVELRDTAARVVANVRKALASGRSVRPAGQQAACRWDHSDLTTVPLQAACAALEAFGPRDLLSGAEDALAEARVMLRLRPLLNQELWKELLNVLDGTHASHANNEELLAMRAEVEDMNHVLESELVSAMKGGRSEKKIGEAILFVERGLGGAVVKGSDGAPVKTYVAPVSWDHSGIDTQRLEASVAALKSFPRQSADSSHLLQMASTALQIRVCIKGEKWAELEQLLSRIQGEEGLQDMEEVRLAGQELITRELERATKKLDQPALKAGLARATALGMQKSEKPVKAALDVFIDPPEFIAMPRGEVWPDSDGKIVLSVTVRGADSIQWLKNGIALKEGADKGRIVGVHTRTLVIHSLLGRDKNQKIKATAKNRWGLVQSTEVTIRTSAADAEGGEVEPSEQPREIRPELASQLGELVATKAVGKSASSAISSKLKVGALFGLSSSKSLKVGASASELTGGSSMKSTKSLMHTAL